MSEHGQRSKRRREGEKIVLDPTTDGPADRSELQRATPRIGLPGIMQALYDDMHPNIAERLAGYAARVAEALGDVAAVEVAPPVKDRPDAERVMRDLDGLLVVNLTCGPAMRVARLLAETRLPFRLANIQPVPAVRAD
jgi:L-arabinose isomerase